MPWTVWILGFTVLVMLDVFLIVGGILPLAWIYAGAGLCVLFPVATWHGLRKRWLRD